LIRGGKRLQEKIILPLQTNHHPIQLDRIMVQRVSR
jgi:hypothetical protein